MIQWAQQLYTDEKARAGMESICRAVEAGKDVPGLYLAVLASNPAEQLDLYAWPMLRSALRHGKDRKVVALAFGRDAATQLVAKMAWDAYERTGHCDLRKMFE